MVGENNLNGYFARVAASNASVDMDNIGQSLQQNMQQNAVQNTQQSTVPNSTPAAPAPPLNAPQFTQQFTSQSGAQGHSSQPYATQDQNITSNTTQSSIYNEGFSGRQMTAVPTATATTQSFVQAAVAQPEDPAERTFQESIATLNQLKQNLQNIIPVNNTENNRLPNGEQTNVLTNPTYSVQFTNTTQHTHPPQPTAPATNLTYNQSVNNANFSQNNDSKTNSVLAQQVSSQHAGSAHSIPTQQPTGQFTPPAQAQFTSQQPAQQPQPSQVFVPAKSNLSMMMGNTNSAQPQGHQNSALTSQYPMNNTNTNLQNNAVQTNPVLNTSVAPMNSQPTQMSVNQVESTLFPAQLRQTQLTEQQLIQQPHHVNNFSPNNQSISTAVNEAQNTNNVGGQVQSIQQSTQLNPQHQGSVNALNQQGEVDKNILASINSDNLTEKLSIGELNANRIAAPQPQSAVVQVAGQNHTPTNNADDLFAGDEQATSPNSAAKHNKGALVSVIIKRALLSMITIIVLLILGFMVITVLPNFIPNFTRPPFWFSVQKILPFLS